LRSCSSWLRTRVAMASSAVRRAAMSDARPVRVFGEDRQGRFPSPSHAVADGRVPVSWIPPGQVCERRVLLQLTGTWPRSMSPGLSGCTPRCSTRASPAWPAGCPTRRRARCWSTHRHRAVGDGRAGRRGRAAQDRQPRGRARAGACPNRGDRLGVPRRRPTVLLLRPGGPARRPGRHRAFLRRQAHPGHLSHQGPPILRWALFGPATRPHAPAPPTTATTPTSRRGSTPTGPPCRSPASSPAAPTTSCAAPRNGRLEPRSQTERPGHLSTLQPHLTAAWPDRYADVRASLGRWPNHR
jgi:hypothetical protein